MKKFAATLAIVVLVISSLSLEITSANAAIRNTPGLSAMGTRAFSDLTRCINTKQKLDVFYLVDQSNSLPLTDPSAARAGILATSLKELAGFDSKISVNYAVAFFGSSFDLWKPFTPVQSSTIASEAQTFGSEVKTRDTQNETNWLLGLNGAAKVLRTQEKSSGACQALIWLTDGGIWLAKGNSSSEIDQPAVDAASSTLCDSTFSDFRKSNVSVFGVLLDNVQALKQIYKNNRVYYGQNDRGMALMRPLIEGSGSTLPGQLSTTCGGEVLPNYSAGALLIAKDPIALALQFLILGGQTHGGTPTDLSPGNPTSFDIERGIRKFQLLTTSSRWSLTSPAGVTYRNGTTKLDVQDLNGIQQLTVAGNNLTLGKWQFGFDETGQVSNRLLLFSGLEIQLDPGQYIGGQKTYIAGQVVVAGSIEKVKLSDYRTHDFEIDQVTSTGESLKILNVAIDNSGRFSAPFDLTTNQANLEIRISLKLSTFNGQSLADVSISKFLTVLLPANYPNPDSPIVLSSLDGPNGTGRGFLTVHGPKSGVGKICLTGSSPYGITITRDAIKRASTYSWQISGMDSTNCQAIAEGQARKFEILVKNSKTADSNVIAELPLQFFSAQNSDAIRVSVPVDFQTTIIRAGRGIIKLLLFLLGIGLPIVILYLLNRAASKLIFGTGIQRATYNVKVDSLSGIAATSGGSVLPLADDFKFIAQQPDTARYGDAVGTLRSKVSLIPLREPWYEIESLPGFRIVTVFPGSGKSGERRGARFKSGQVARIRADMDKFWVIQISEKDLQSVHSISSVNGLLVVYKRNKLGAKDQHLDRIAEVMTTAGVWARITEMKNTPLAEIKLTKPLKGSVRKAKKREQEISVKSTPPIPKLSPFLPPDPPILPPMPPGSS